MQSVASDGDEELPVAMMMTFPPSTGAHTHTKSTDEDFQVLYSDKGSPAELSSGDESGAMASDASGDRDMVNKGPKMEVKVKVKDGDDKGKALPGGGGKEDDDEDDGDGKKKKAKKAKAKQPASVPKKPTKGGNSELNGTDFAWGQCD